MRGIAEGGVLAIQIHHEERDGSGPVADGDEVKVIGHFGVGGDPNLALFAERANQGEEMMAVLVGAEYGLLVVAKWGEMKPVATSNWAAQSEVCVAFHPPYISRFWRRNFSLILQKNAFV